MQTIVTFPGEDAEGAAACQQNRSRLQEEVPGDSAEERQDNGPRMSAGRFVQFHHHLDHAPSAMDCGSQRDVAGKKSAAA